MTTVADEPPKTSRKRDFDPDSYRMTIGEHLEELRRRLILGILGFAIALTVCLFFGDQVLLGFCRPLYNALAAQGISPRISYHELGEGFMSWIQANVITAIAIASPWLVYQVWLFVAAGLYPHERKYVTRYAPLSIALMIAGMLFVYFLVLPWSITFFLNFSGTIHPGGADVTTTQPHATVILPELAGDPVHPANNEIWINTVTDRINVYRHGIISSIPLTSQNLLTPDIKLADYIDLFVNMLVLFGLSFQMPLVVLALVRIGILSIEQLKGMRRYVYFALAVLAAAITPGTDITSMLALTVPLCMLFELGLWLARIPRGAGAR